MKKILAITLLLACSLGLFAQPTARYGVKSAIVKTVSIMGDNKSYDTHWIDDYGDKEKNITTMEMPGFGHYEATILMVGDELWGINQNGDAKKSKEGRPPRNWRALTNQEIKQFEIKDLGTETYKGKTCQVYSYREKQLMTKVDVTVWVWEGIVIRQHIKKKMSETWVELESIQVNVKIPANTFAIPENAD